MQTKADPSLYVDIVLADEIARANLSELPALGVAPLKPAFDADSTLHFQAKMNKAPEWFCSILASNTREKRRFSSELIHMRGAWPLLMKQRNGGKWTPEEKARLKLMVRSASNVSPYLFIWAIPGSMLLLPFLAWFLDKRRKKKASKAKNLS